MCACVRYFLYIFVCALHVRDNELEHVLWLDATRSSIPCARYPPPPLSYASQVCANAVGVVGDVCRAVEEGVLPYCDGIMGALIRGLQVRPGGGSPPSLPAFLPR